MFQLKDPISWLVRKASIEGMAHLLVFLSFLGIFWGIFRGGFILFGDLATTFPVNQNLYLKEFTTAWADNAFLGYNALLYTVIRAPFYILTDTITSLFGPQNWWIFLVVMYGLRYYLFFVLLRFLGVRWQTSLLVSVLYSFNFFFIDRLGHTLISFASVAVPGLIVGFLQSAQKLTIKSVVAFILSAWIVLSSMHVTLMSLYFFCVLFLWEGYNCFRRGAFKKYVVNVAILIIITISTLAALFIPAVYQLYFSEGESLISQVGSQASEAIYAYSKTTIMPYPLIGLGFYASGYWDYPVVMLIALLYLLGALVIILKEFRIQRGGPFYLSLLIFGGLASFSLLEPFIHILKGLLPGFNSIKDSSYFILFLIISLFVLLALSIEKATKKIRYTFLISFTIFIVFANILALTRFRDFKTTQLPPELLQVTEVLEKDKRTLVLPLGWVSRFPWSNDQIMSGFFTLLMSDHQIVGQNIIEGPSILTQEYLDKFYYCFQSNCPELTRWFDQLDVDQVVWFKGGKHEFKDVVYDYTPTIQHLITQKLLVSAAKNDYFEAFYWQEADEGRVRGVVQYERISPTKYEVVMNLSKSTELKLLTSFDPNWRVFPSRRILDESCSAKARFDCDSMVSHWVEDLKRLVQKDYFNHTHDKAFGYANSWEVTQDSVEGKLPSQAYRKSESGEVVVGLTLYYLPQAAITLGILGTLVSLAITGLVLAIIKISKRNGNN